MKTVITLENSNCTRCHNAMLGMLREKKGVRHVQSDFSSGCLVIEHDDDPDGLLSLIRAADRSISVACNGEREMVPVDGHEADECRALKGTVPAPLDVATSTMTVTVTRTVEASRAPSTSCSPPGTWPPAVSMRPVSPMDGSGRREGVRVLVRERPAPGSLLRAMRFAARTYRVVFHLPMAPR